VYCVFVTFSHVGQLFVEGKWHTWIDYPKFHSLYKEWLESKKEFTAFDYMAETPPWAVYGAREKGFDPVETRVRKRGKQARINRAKRSEQKVEDGSTNDTRKEKI